MLDRRVGSLMCDLFLDTFMRITMVHSWWMVALWLLLASLLLSQTCALSSNGSRKRLENCICLVTGASRGIGKGIAIELGRQGATVYVTGTSTVTKDPRSKGLYTTNDEVGGPGSIEETADAVRNAGGQGVGVLCNHAVDSDVDRVMDQIAHDHGHLDILINNVFRVPTGGTSKLYGKFWELDVDVWDTVHNIGLRSHYVATCKAMPLLLKARGRRQVIPRPFIGMISSFGGISYTFNVPYGVGKAGVERLTKDMAMELNDEDICVVSFWPGLVATERTNRMVANGEWDRYVGFPLDNAESPYFTGRAVVAVATDPLNMKRSGKYHVVAELAREYAFTDVDGRQPPSIRSLRNLLPSFAFDDKTRERIPASMIPDIKLPFWMMAGGIPPKPKEE